MDGQTDILMYGSTARLMDGWIDRRSYSQMGMYTARLMDIQTGGQTTTKGRLDTVG